jgi:hypothetical protein
MIDLGCSRIELGTEKVFFLTLGNFQGTIGDIFGGNMFTFQLYLQADSFSIKTRPDI